MTTGHCGHSNLLGYPARSHRRNRLWTGGTWKLRRGAAVRPSPWIRVSAPASASAVGGRAPASATGFGPRRDDERHRAAGREHACRRFGSIRMTRPDVTVSDGSETTLGDEPGVDDGRGRVAPRACPRGPPGRRSASAPASRGRLRRRDRLRRRRRGRRRLAADVRARRGTPATSAYCGCAKTCFMYDCPQERRPGAAGDLLDRPPILAADRLLRPPAVRRPIWLSDTSVTMFGVKPTNQADLLSLRRPGLAGDRPAERLDPVLARPRLRRPAASRRSCRR